MTKISYLLLALITCTAGCSSPNPGSTPSSNPSASVAPTANPSGSPTTSPTTSPSASASATTAPSPSPTASASALSINGCTNYVDRTGADADRDLTWDFPIGTDQERCIKIKAGQDVRFNGSFSVHPLREAGGTTPNPFAGAAQLVSNPGLTGQEFTTISFSTPGTYGYVCSFHPNMTGAVQVVP